MIKKANIKKTYNLTMKFDSIDKSKLHLDIQNIFKKWYNRKIKVIISKISAEKKTQMFLNNTKYCFSKRKN
jgi:hypothetical protein